MLDNRAKKLMAVIFNPLGGIRIVIWKDPPSDHIASVFSKTLLDIFNPEGIHFYVIISNSQDFPLGLGNTEVKGV